MREINLMEHFKILVKRKWIIIITTIITTLLSFLVSKYLIVPTYSATSILIVGNTQINEGNNGTDYTSLLFYDKLIATYSKILQSKNILNNVVYKLPFKTTVESIENNLTIATKQDTLLIYVTVKGNDPEKVMKISNQISISFVEKVTDIMNLKKNVNILDLAEIPKAPVYPKVLLNTIIAFFLGVMISIFIVLVLEYFDNTIKSSEDIKRYSDLPTLGTIPFYDEKNAEKEDSSNEYYEKNNNTF